MMAKVAWDKNPSFVRIARQSMVLKEAEEEENKKQKVAQRTTAPHLPEDCVSCILLQLPIDALQRSRSVCKGWYDILHGQVLINDHAYGCEPVLLFQTLSMKMQTSSTQPAMKDTATCFSVEEACLVAPSTFFNRPSLPIWGQVYLHFMEFVNGECVVKDLNVSSFGRIVASCNGLVLLENKIKNGGLILINPVTRKLFALPVGTISAPHRRSYGLVFDPSAAVYKVVHMFSDMENFTHCEILEVGARWWRMGSGTLFGSSGLMSWFGYRPVFAIGALHWLPQIDHNDYIVSMDIAKESFKTIDFPESGRITDRILEMGGLLCFFAHEGDYHINIWQLKGLSDEWTRIHSITNCCIPDMVPISRSRSGDEIIFTRDEDGGFYVYDFHLEKLKIIETGDISCPLDTSYFPHVNSLISWSMGEGNRCK